MIADHTRRMKPVVVLFWLWKLIRFYADNDDGTDRFELHNPRAWPFAAARSEQGLALLLGVIALLLTTPVRGADSRPNIVIILSDDMGYADIGEHGCRDIPTPHIDRLAAEGVRFTNAYANGSFCTPTRAAPSAAATSNAMAWRT